MTCWLHIYSPTKGVIRTVSGPNREFRGRPSVLLKSFQIWPDGQLTEVEPRCGKRTPAS